MIIKLYAGIAAGLKAVKDCKIYREDVPENFVRPSFMVTFYDQNPTRGINGRLKNTVKADLLYFPEDEENYQEECWSVNEDLIREFLIPGFKMKNRNSKITDKVLHFMFSVDCREFRNSDAVKMGPMTLTEKIKEE